MPSLFSRALNSLSNEGLDTFLSKTVNYMRRKFLLGYVPTNVYARVAPFYWRLRGASEPIRIRRGPQDGVWVVTDVEGGRVFTPNPKIKTGRHLHTADRLRDNTLPGFVDVEVGDVVMDVGAFVGAFSIAVADLAEQVYAVEADPANAYCVRQNTAENENIEVIQRAVWNEPTSIQFQIGDDPTDSSVLAPDFGGQRETVSVPAETLDKIFTRYDIEKVDFLKMDVEGVEPEALEGMNSVKPKKAAIDTGAEREGETTTEEVIAILAAEGYDTQTEGRMVFARLAD